VPKEHYQNYKQALSLAAYHFRELMHAGLLEIAETIPRRGATEHVYRGLARVYFTDAEFERLAPKERRQFSRISFQGLVARVDSAMFHDTFDSRTDRHLVWMPLSLDEQGWDELGVAMTTCFGEVERIRHESKDRLAGTGDPVVSATFGMVGFESPSPPPLRGADPPR
jgi:hypothetical protein